MLLFLAFIKLRDEELVHSCGIIQIYMVASVGDAIHLAIIIAGFAEILERLQPALGVHPIVFTINEGYWYLEPRYSVDKRHTGMGIGRKNMGYAILS